MNDMFENDFITELISFAVDTAIILFLYINIIPVRSFKKTMQCVGTFITRDEKLHQFKGELEKKRDFKIWLLKN